MNTTLAIQPLNEHSFGPYGQVLALHGSAGRSINAGTTERLDLPGALDLLRAGGQPVLAVFCARAQDEAGPWHTLERHRLGSQSFVPLGEARWLVLVARGEHAPDMSTLAAFEAAPGQGITLHADTWHHPLIALAPSRFLVIERAGAGVAAEVDCELSQLASPVRLVRA